MNGVDGRVILSAGSYGIFFVGGVAIIVTGIFLLVLATRSALAARSSSERFSTLAYVTTVLGLLLVFLPIYPLGLLVGATDLAVESEETLVRFTTTMIRITSRGFSLYKNDLPQPDPDATPTPLYTRDETPIYGETPTAGPEPTEIPPGSATDEPTPTATVPVLNPNEGPPTPTQDIVELATQNAAGIAGTPGAAVPTLDPNKWNPQTPPATPVR